MKRTQLCALAVLLTVSPVTKAWEISGKKETYLNSKESAAQSTAQLQVLQNLQQEMTSKFSEIESEISAGNTQRALTLAKNVLDTVKVKTGIDPKNKIQEKFLIATKFPANAKSMNDLSEEQQDLVIRTISDYRGGLYLDIMNLSKRTTLLYIKAFQAQLAKSGGLTNADKEKIVNDLVKASLIPMPLEDKGKTKITVFDEDVANEDHTYLFNRELMMFLIQNTDLKVSEADFETKKLELKTSFVGNVQATSLDKPGFQCMGQANFVNYWDDRNAATVKCFNKYYRQTGSMMECKRLADMVNYHDDRNAATKKCFNKFNQ